jgi:hypothetical protein
VHHVHTVLYRIKLSAAIACSARNQASDQWINATVDSMLAGLLFSPVHADVHYDKGTPLLQLALAED